MQFAQSQQSLVHTIYFDNTFIRSIEIFHIRQRPIHTYMTVGKLCSFTFNVIQRTKWEPILSLGIGNDIEPMNSLFIRARMLSI